MNPFFRTLAVTYYHTISQSIFLGIIITEQLDLAAGAYTY
jgi:hypothetical protein